MVLVLNITAFADVYCHLLYPKICKMISIACLNVISGLQYQFAVQVAYRVEDERGTISHTLDEIDVAILKLKSPVICIAPAKVQLERLQPYCERMYHHTCLKCFTDKFIICKMQISTQ